MVNAMGRNGQRYRMSWVTLTVAFFGGYTGGEIENGKRRFTTHGLHRYGGIRIVE